MPVMPIVIILAGGRGARFLASGGYGSKLQAPLAGKTVLQHTLDAVKASGLPWHLEDGGRPGMGDSIAAAVRATWSAASRFGAERGGWLILPADLPLIRADTLHAVATALLGHEVVVPIYHGQRGHPVGFSARCGQALLDLGGDHGAAPVIQAYAAIEIMVNDVGCVTDIDTIDDLKVVEQLMNGA
jgi:molybdenum cofactor cytidylyltransferase